MENNKHPFVALLYPQGGTVVIKTGRKSLVTEGPLTRDAFKGALTPNGRFAVVVTRPGGGERVVVRVVDVDGEEKERIQDLGDVKAVIGRQVDRGVEIYATDRSGRLAAMVVNDDGGVRVYEQREEDETLRGTLLVYGGDVYCTRLKSVLTPVKIAFNRRCASFSIEVSRSGFWSFCFGGLDYSVRCEIATCERGRHEWYAVISDARRRVFRIKVNQFFSVNVAHGASVVAINLLRGADETQNQTVLFDGRTAQLLDCAFFGFTGNENRFLSRAPDGTLWLSGEKNRFVARCAENIQVGHNVVSVFSPTERMVVYIAHAGGARLGFDAVAEAPTVFIR